MLLYDRMVFMQIGVNKVKHIIYGFVDNGISYGRSKKKMVASMFPVSSEIYGLEGDTPRTSEMDTLWCYYTTMG